MCHRDKHNGIHDPALATVLNFTNKRTVYAFNHNSVEKSKVVPSREDPQHEKEFRGNDNNLPNEERSMR